MHPGKLKYTTPYYKYMLDDNKKNNKKMAEAKRIKLYPNKEVINKEDHKKEAIEGLFKDLLEIDDMLNEYSEDEL